MQKGTRVAWRWLRTRDGAVAAEHDKYAYADT